MAKYDYLLGLFLWTCSSTQVIPMEGLLSQHLVVTYPLLSNLFYMSRKADGYHIVVLGVIIKANWK